MSDELEDLMMQAVTDSMITCPKCGSNMEADCPRCVECGWKNALMEAGLI